MQSTAVGHLDTNCCGTAAFIRTYGSHIDRDKTWCWWNLSWGSLSIDTPSARSHVQTPEPTNYITRPIMEAYRTATERALPSNLCSWFGSLELNYFLTSWHITCTPLQYKATWLRTLILFNLLEPELFFLILAHPVYKMWIRQESNTLELWNKLHF